MCANVEGGLLTAKYIGILYIYIYIWLRDDIRNPPVTVVTKRDGESQKRDGEYSRGIL